MLDIDHVAVGYNGATVLQDVSISADAGQFIAVLGPNGAGKTTLLKTISGLLRPRQGIIHFGGDRIDGWEPHRIVSTGLIHCPEGRRVFPGLTVLENLRLGATRTRRAEQVNLDHVHELFPRLYERRGQRAATLSGGEQQMLALGRSLMGQPKLLMLDEPSMGLAPVVADLVFDAIRKIRQEGVTILLVEQNADRALALTDYAYVLERGRVSTAGSSRNVAASPQIREAYLGVERNDP